MTASFRQLETVCKALGLVCKNVKKGRLWSGFVNGRHVRICIHIHQEGREITTGLFRTYVKELGFSSEQDFFDYLRCL